MFIFIFKQKTNEELAKCADCLFDILDHAADTKKCRASAWPLQIMLLLLSPVSKNH